MIIGIVNARHELRIQLRVRSPSGQEQDVETLLDTGFNGSLTLPPSVILSLGLPWISRGTAILANGNVVQFDIYAGKVIWDGNPRSILIQSVDTVPLLGMALLIDYDIRARMKVGGLVEIEKVP